VDRDRLDDISRCPPPSLVRLPGKFLSIYSRAANQEMTFPILDRAGMVPEIKSKWRQHEFTF
jgi:hypothetical protein